MGGDTGRSKPKTNPVLKGEVDMASIRRSGRHAGGRHPANYPASEKVANSSARTACRAVERHETVTYTAWHKGLDPAVVRELNER